jgi:hypothetical protein
MNKFVATILLALTSFSAFADSDWALFAKQPKSVWEFEKGSLRIQTDQNNAVFWSVMFRVRDPTDANASYVFWRLAIEIADCAAGEGEILFLSPKARVEHREPFVTKGETLAGLLAVNICRAGEILKQNSEPLPDKNSADDKPKYST